MAVTPEQAAAGVPPDAQDVQEVPTGNQQQVNRWAATGYGPDGKPTPAMLLDSQAPPDPHVRALQTGQQNAQDQANVIAIQGQNTRQDVKPAAPPPITPYDMVLKDHDPDTLMRAAQAAGIDVTKLPQGYFEDMSKHYDNIEKPSTLQAVRAWYDASGIGHFMQGYDDADTTKYGRKTAWYDALDSAGASNPDKRDADRFFNAHIQARIIDGSQYIDANGNYNPPASYKAGKLLGQPSTGYGTLGGLAALTGLTGAVRGTLTFAMNHPAAGAVIYKAVTGTAMGAALIKYLTSGNAAPPP